MRRGMQKKDVLSDSPFGLPLSLTLLPERMRSLGYATAMVGKCGPGPEALGVALLSFSGRLFV